MMGDIITDVEKYKKGWRGGLPETPCGYGSRLDQTVEQRKWIPKLIRKYKIKSIADIGAGDLNWIKQTKLPKTVDYKAYDLVPRAQEVEEFNLLTQIPPQVDMIMCLWVLNHFTLDDCRKAIENLKASRAKYLLMTDRPIWYKEQPPEIEMPYIEELVLNEKQDSIRLIELC